VGGDPARRNSSPSRAATPLTSDTVGADPFAIASARLDELYGLGVRSSRSSITGTTTWATPSRSGIRTTRRFRTAGLTPLAAHVVAGMQEKGNARRRRARERGIRSRTSSGSPSPRRSRSSIPTPALRPDVGPLPSRRLRSREEMELIAETGGVVCSWPFAWQTDAASRHDVADWAGEIVAMKKAIGMAHVGWGPTAAGTSPP